MINNRAIQLAAAVVVVVILATASLWTTDTRAPTQTPASVPEAVEAESSVRSREAQSLAAFDFYILVLSWSPTHCASDAGAGRDDDLQCRSGRPYGFVLHGLWPQNERGYPQYCASSAPRTVPEDLVDKVMDLTPSRELVQHEWERHGTCSGLSQEDYFGAARRAVESISVPRAYVAPERPIVTTADAVRRALVAQNPALDADDISATCRRGELAEVWICLDRDLAPRACSNEVRKKHCGDRRVRMLAVRGDWPGR
jgi:ribonuclease T2